jgi:hypothetical protein
MDSSSLTSIYSGLTAFAGLMAGLTILGLIAAVLSRRMADSFYLKGLHYARVATIEAGGLPRYRQDASAPSPRTKQPQRRSCRPTVPVQPLPMARIVAGEQEPRLPALAAAELRLERRLKQARALNASGILETADGPVYLLKPRSHVVRARSCKATELLDQGRKCSRAGTKLLLDGQPEKARLMRELADLAQAFAELS